MMDTFKQDLCEGLSHEPKSIPPKYLYDEVGSKLFEAICELEEYYPTRTETKILCSHAAEICEAMGPSVLLIEPGSGSSKKVQCLLPVMKDPVAYIPMEISKEILYQSAEELNEKFPTFPVLPVCMDYTESLELPKSAELDRLLKGKNPPAKRVVFFPGSTIGNFDPQEAQTFIGKMHEMVGARGGLLIGVDLKKDSQTLKRAYDDSKGVTAQFNLNLLNRANRELGASFDPQRFRHDAFYNFEAGRVEMHLVSADAQTIRIDEDEFTFRKGESIHTESSYKYSIHQFTTLVEATGFQLMEYWTDPKQLFCMFYFERAE